LLNFISLISYLDFIDMYYSSTSIST